MKTIEERFWAKVRVTPHCWEWQASLHTQGYGQIGVGRTPRLAHRVSYELHYGPIPDGLVVRHRCDNKICVNPDHLLLGTAADNSRDAMERGLLPYGDRNPQTRLTVKQVAEIRAQRGVPQKDLAARYGVTQAHISNIQIGKRRASA
jgi:hypothetical protein